MIRSHLDSIWWLCSTLAVFLLSTPWCTAIEFMLALCPFAAYVTVWDIKDIYANNIAARLYLVCLSHSTIFLRQQIRRINECTGSAIYRSPKAS
jgi:hypothetical protein